MLHESEFYAVCVSCNQVEVVTGIPALSHICDRCSHLLAEWSESPTTLPFERFRALSPFTRRALAGQLPPAATPANEPAL